MLCNKCGKNEATVYFSQNINGSKTEYTLCRECAKEMDLNSLFEKHRQYVAKNFFAPVSTFGFPFEGFFETPMLSDSFFDFSPEKPVLSQREEKENPPEDKLTSLRRQLDEAVKSERYEDAARFRDEIRAMEK